MKIRKKEKQAERVAKSIHDETDERRSAKVILWRSHGRV